MYQYSPDLADSFNFRKNRKKTLTKPTKPKTYAFSRWRRKYRCSGINKAQAPLSGQLPQWPKSWNVDVPIWSRPLTVESTDAIEHIWSPYVMTAPLFKTIQQKGEEPAKKQVLSRPSIKQGKICVFWEWHDIYGHQIHDVWWPWPTSNTPHITPVITPRCYSPRSLSCSPPVSLPSRESSVEPSSEDSSPEGRKRHQSEPAFIRPHNIDKGLTHGLSALQAETSPLAPCRIQQQAKVKAQEKISTQKWPLSRPFWRRKRH